MNRPRVSITRLLVGPVLVCANLCVGLACVYGQAGPLPLQDSDIKRFTTFYDGKRVIHIPAGVYIVDRAIILPSDTVLEGAGPATVLRASSGFRGSRFISNSDLTRGNANITLRSFLVEFATKVFGGETGVIRFENVENLQIEEVSMDLNTSMYGIDLAAHVRDSTIQGCTIVNKGGGGGIMVRNRNVSPTCATSGVEISSNRITSFVDEPIAVFGWMGVVHNIRVEQNEIDAQDASFGITVYGIDQIKHTGTIEGVIVSGNRVRGGRVGGIAVKGGARNVELTGNVIDGQRADAIFLHTGGEGLPGVSNVIIRGNKLTNAGRHCIFASGNALTIQDNSISNCREAGIYVGGPASVIGNAIRDAKPGMLVTVKGPKVIRENRVISSSGIIVLSNDRSGISDNIIEQSSQPALPKRPE